MAVERRHDERKRSRERERNAGNGRTRNELQAAGGAAVHMNGGASRWNGARVETVAEHGAVRVTQKRGPRNHPGEVQCRCAGRCAENREKVQKEPRTQAV